MDISRRKEEFGYAYIQAVASAAGYGIVRPPVDDDSVDIQFLSHKSNPYVRSPRLEAQLKCTAQELEHENNIHLPIKIKNYDDLRSSNVLVPRILICIVLPDDEPSSWLKQSEESLILMRCGYWLSLNGYDEKLNESNVTVRLPKLQIFNVEALTELMENVGAMCVCT